MLNAYPIYSQSNLPLGATFDSETGMFSWTPEVGQAGTYTIRFSVSDGLAEDFEDVIITVEPAAPAPPDAPDAPSAPPPADGGAPPAAPAGGGVVPVVIPTGMAMANSLLNTIVGVVIVGGIIITTLKLQDWRMLVVWLAGGLIAKLIGDILIGTFV